MYEMEEYKFISRNIVSFQLMYLIIIVQRLDRNLLISGLEISIASASKVK
jgi:hypothetical protein